MYLYRKHYVGNKHKDSDKQVKIDVPGVKQERVTEIVEEVKYWRKANAIHMWFVDNVQDGEDDCKEYLVEAEQLQELVDTCSKVIEASKLVAGQIINGYKWENDKKIPIIEEGKNIQDPTIAKELLPTSDGFFFGGTEYDEYYYNDILGTRDALKELLSEGIEADYYYHSSW